MQKERKEIEHNIKKAVRCEKKGVVTIYSAWIYRVKERMERNIASS
jgi:hypothetical protein